MPDQHNSGNTDTRAQLAFLFPCRLSAETIMPSIGDNTEKPDTDVR